jgi:DNA end-binding protein Ku
MFSAIDEQQLHFHLLHEKDDSRIGYEKVCKKEDKPVPDDEIVKAYEFDDGKYVYMTDEDFEAAAGKSYRSIDILDFVPYDEIDPIYFERTYYLAPADGAEKVYALLLKAMDQSGLAAIVRYVMRDKEHLGCLRIREGAITLERMYFADEIRDVDDIKPDKASVPKRELEMAAQLIDQFSGSFEPEKYEDTYREALLAIVKEKRKGREIHREPQPAEEEPTDLLTALRASLDQRTRGTRRDAELQGLPKEELERRAREAGIKGRSRMSKDELVEALEAA